MSPTIYLSCLLFIIGSLLWTASAQQDFDSDRAHVLEVYKNADPAQIGNSNVIFLLHFLNKYANEIQMTPDQRSKAADIVSQYHEEKANQPLVDGVPAQGGWLSMLLSEAIIQLGIELASKGFMKATNHYVLM